MDAKPLNISSPTHDKTDPISVDQALRLVDFTVFHQEFFSIHIANRLYLPHGLG